MKRIDFYLDFISPYAYLAFEQLPRALEGLSYDSVIGPVRMRADNHQLLLPQVVNTIAKVDGKKVTMGWEGTNYGFSTDASYSGNELAQGNACKMARP